MSCRPCQAEALRKTQSIPKISEVNSLSTHVLAVHSEFIPTATGIDVPAIKIVSVLVSRLCEDGSVECLSTLVSLNLHGFAARLGTFTNPIIGALIGSSVGIVQQKEGG